MDSPLRRIEQFIASDDLAAALAVLADGMADAPGDLQNELIQHRATLAKLTKERRQGLIDDAREALVLSRLRQGILGLAREWDRKRQHPAVPQPAGDATHTPDSADAAEPLPKVFISYSRTDADVARELKAALEFNQIRVWIDEQDLAPGEDIAAFIARAVGEVDVVLSIVSERRGIVRLEGREAIPIELGGADVHQVLAHRGAVWVLTSAGVFRLNGDRAEPLTVPVLSYTGLASLRGSTWLFAATGAVRLLGGDVTVIETERAVRDVVRVRGATWILAADETTGAGPAYRVRGDKAIAHAPGGTGVAAVVDYADATWVLTRRDGRAGPMIRVGG